MTTMPKKPSKLVLAAAAIMALAGAADANPFNSGAQGQPIQAGAATDGSPYVLYNINSDQLITTNTGTVVVWSQQDDHVLRKYTGLGGAFGTTDLFGHPNAGWTDYTYNVPAFLYLNGTCQTCQYQGINSWKMQFQLTLGSYGPSSYISKVGHPDVDFASGSTTERTYADNNPGDYITANGVSNVGLSFYNKAQINPAPAGGFDILNAWAGVTPLWRVDENGQANYQRMMKPSNAALQRAWANYVAEYALDKLPTVTATWRGSLGTFYSISSQQCNAINANGESLWTDDGGPLDPCNTYGGSYNFNMINGTDTKLCDPVQLQFNPDMASAVFVVNGVYCAYMAVHNYPAGDTGVSLPVPTPPLQLNQGTLPTGDGSPLTAGSWSTIYRGANGSNPMPFGGGSCADIANPNGSC